MDNGPPGYFPCYKCLSLVQNSLKGSIFHSRGPAVYSCQSQFVGTTMVYGHSIMIVRYIEVVWPKGCQVGTKIILKYS